jgi:hypothetical protein
MTKNTKLYNLYMDAMTLHGKDALTEYASQSSLHAQAVTLRNAFSYLLKKDSKLESWRQSLFIKEKEDITQQLHTCVLGAYDMIEKKCRIAAALESNPALIRDYIKERKAAALAYVDRWERRHGLTDDEKDMLRKRINDSFQLRSASVRVVVKRPVTTYDVVPHSNGGVETETTLVKTQVYSIDELTEKELFWLIVGQARNDLRRYIIETYASVNSHVSIESRLATVGLDEYGETGAAIVETLQDKGAQLGYDTVTMLESIRGALTPVQYEYCRDIITGGGAGAQGAGQDRHMNSRIRRNVALLQTLDRIGLHEARIAE